MNFKDKLEKAIVENQSLLCVGLDPDPENPKSRNQFLFNKKIIDQTANLVCCYKTQIAFFAAAGLKGLTDLKKTINYIKTAYQMPVILDAKRGDVENTSQMYAKEAFDFFNADAVTVNPYLGTDSLVPFFERKERGVFVITRTSNPGAVDFQDLKVGHVPLYLKIAQMVVRWNKKYSNVFLEIGATWPREIGILRKMAPSMPFLVAGIGAQGGDLKSTLLNGLTRDGDGLIINASRSIIYAQHPALAAKNLRDEINKYR